VKLLAKKKLKKHKEESWRIRDEDYNDPKFCPVCRKKDVILNAFMPNGGYGSWCPNCKKPVESLTKIPIPKKGL
jgi:hypothetical protein